MENLNAEQVKKWLEICAEDTPYPDQSQALLDALALITSQEQRIKELTEENEMLKADCAKGANALVEEMQKNRTIEAATVRKMRSMLCEGRVSNDNVVIVANQVTKEMLEGKK